MRVKLVVVSSCLLSLSLIWAGCGYTELSRREPLESIKVDLGERTLDPSEITLDRPGTYAFEVENVAGNVAHAFEIEGKEGAQVNNRKDGSVRSDDLPPGESTKVQVELGPGTYEIADPVASHKNQGMKGTLTVEEG